jgi:hypothetical protein
MDTNRREWNFEKLVGTIRLVHEELAAQAGKAVNVSLTVRNWLFGCYIAEYELNGLDRANYGDRLLTELANRLTELNVSNCNRRQLYRYLRFYRLYPEIVGTLSAQMKKMLPTGAKALEKMGTVSPQLRTPPDKIIQRLSYSHLELIVDLDDDMKRLFYEIECIRGNWSVRELKRQIASLYYERSGLSKDKKKLAKLAQQGAEAADAPNATKRWWNMPWPVWTTAFSFPSTSLNCQKRRICNDLSKNRFGNRSHDDMKGIIACYFRPEVTQSRHNSVMPMNEVGQWKSDQVSCGS